MNIYNKIICHISISISILAFEYSNLIRSKYNIKST